VLWWVSAGHIPDLGEAFAHLQLLRRDGPGPAAFTFREPYPPAADEPGEQRAGRGGHPGHGLCPSGPLQESATR
jgi:hypothetical protein